MQHYTVFVDYHQVYVWDENILKSHTRVDSWTEHAYL
jgi:hypothetical protein